MTHMDDQVAKHIKEMIRRIKQRPTETHDEGPHPDTLNRVARILRRGNDPYGLIPLTRSPWWDADPKA
jgi:hypothetical protein